MHNEGLSPNLKLYIFGANVGEAIFEKSHVCRPSPQPSPHASAAHGEREQDYSLAKPFAASSSRYAPQRWSFSRPNKCR